MKNSMFKKKNPIVQKPVNEKNKSIAIKPDVNGKTGMPSLVDWIDNKMISTYVLTVSLLAGYAAIYLFPGIPWIVYSALVASIICPFAIFLVWLVDTTWINKLLARRWTAILFAGVVVIYGMYANTFASNLINDYFKVDPTHFTVTSSFLTIIFMLVGVFKPLVLTPIYVALIIFGGFAIVWLLFYREIKRSLKQVILLILLMIIVSSSDRNLYLLEANLPSLAEKVALWADFNEKHRCTAKWPADVDKVIFLQDGNVLAHITSGRNNYEVLPCIPSETKH